MGSLFKATDNRHRAIPPRQRLRHPNIDWVDVTCGTPFQATPYTFHTSFGRTLNTFPRSPVRASPRWLPCSTLSLCALSVSSAYIKLGSQGILARRVQLHRAERCETCGVGLPASLRCLALDAQCHLAIRGADAFLTSLSYYTLTT